MNCNSHDQVEANQSGNEPSDNQLEKGHGAKIFDVKEHSNHQTIERKAKQVHDCGARAFRDHLATQSPGRGKVNATSNLKQKKRTKKNTPI